MNDSEAVDVVRDSLTTAKDSLTGVRVNAPLDAIVRNGRARRRRHRLTGLTGAVAVTAGAAMAVTALASSGHPARQPGHSADSPLITRLAAWTVAKQGNGDIKITIRELSDPSGLQRTLRADGVPANVSSSTQLNPSCQRYPMTQALFTSIYHAQKGETSGNTVLVIHPSALPSGAGVQIGASRDGRAADRGLHQVAGNQTVHHIARQPVHRAAARADNTVLRVGLVYTSQQCTGS
jgi:hypothetical protein